MASPCLPDIQLGSDGDDLSEDDPVEYNRQQFESAQVCSGVAEQELNLSIDEKTQSVVNSMPSTCEPSVKVTQYTARPSTPIYSRSGLLNSPPSLLSLSTSSSTKDASQSLLGHSKGGLLKELIASSHEKATDIRGSPRLNVFTTLPKNFSRFVMKVGPLAEFQNSVEAILLWKSTPGKFIVAITA